MKKNKKYKLIIFYGIGDWGLGIGKKRNIYWLEQEMPQFCCCLCPNQYFLFLDILIKKSIKK